MYEGISINLPTSLSLFRFETKSVYRGAETHYGWVGSRFVFYQSVDLEFPLNLYDL